MPAIDRNWFVRLIELAAAIAFWLYGMTVLAWVAQALHLPLPEMPLLRRAYILFAFSVAVAVWMVARGEGLAAFGLVAPRRWLLLIGRGLILFVAIMIFEIVVTPFTDPIIAQATGTSTTLGVQHFASVKGNLGLFLYLLPFAWLFGGFGEEFLNRGFIMTRIAQLLGEGRGAWIAAVVLQAVPFALGHAYQGPVGMFGVFVIALIYGVGARAWGRNLWPSMIAHGVFDTFGFFAVYIGIAKS